MRKKSQKTSEDRKKSIKRWRVITAIFIVVLFISITMEALLPPVSISKDRVNVYMYTGTAVAPISFLTGGYIVSFDDIADIERLPYSAAQLGYMIDSLHVPAYHYSSSPIHRQVTVGGYRGEYRLHVSLFPEASPTIWITRYENVPVLLSFRQSHETEALYEQLMEAWEAWQSTQ